MRTRSQHILRLCLAVALALTAAGHRCGAEPAAAAPAAAPAAEAPGTPYDLLLARYAPHTDPGDPLGFPMKVLSVDDGRYKFWRGTKDLFFDWCRTAAADWLADEPAFVASHGDPHLGNLGSYPAAGPTFGEMAFGLVDFDDAQRLPFQLDLLQGLVTFDLLADANRIERSPAERARVDATLLAAYREGLAAGKTATDLLRAEPAVAKRLVTGDDRAADYARLLSKQLGPDGRFVRAIAGGKDGAVKDLLEPCASPSRAELAAALAQAVGNDDGLRRALGYASAGEFEPAIVDAVRRTRVGSSGSQGLRKLMVLVRRPPPPHGAGHDVIVYLKQQLPSAAERAGLVPADARTPGERCAAVARLLSDPPPFAASWCEAAGKSYFVTLRDPWSDELDPDEVRTAEDLLAMARVWGVTLGAAHARAGAADRILPRMTDGLAAVLRERADAYGVRLAADVRRFAADPRVARDRDTARAALAREAAAPAAATPRAAAARPTETTEPNPAPARAGPANSASP